MPCTPFDNSTARVPECDGAGAPAEEPLPPLEKEALRWSAAPDELSDVEAKWRLMESASRLELLDPRLPPLTPEQRKDLAGKSPNQALSLRQPDSKIAVSYTHLTLPTILLV